ncbi:MAG: hypothetical protein CBC29_05855 [Methylococcaceae bacterium TMED69]|nr:MAG: hypothetical protein CBC29_05855 [Methylococcaceae bacterium TMED69]|tara:strand:- start:702 stop:1376 length:675 start_codon:yes stop_codon:yes gene_type:complete
MKIYTYDVKKWNFPQLVSEALEVKNLLNLHKDLDNLYVPEEGIAGLGNDTHSFFHDKFYSKVRSGWEKFTEKYYYFIEENISPIFAEEQNLIYQTLPSFRIHYPNGKAITTKHFDGDENHQHPLGELNIFLPLTITYGTNSMWIESLPFLGDFQPLELQPGEFLLWNGNQCRHFNKINTTNISRVSFDFRVLPRQKYDKNYSAKTATTKKRFVVGEYYSELSGG